MANSVTSSRDAKVLVLDDDYGLLSFLRFLLESEGFAVWTAVNGRDGLEQVKNVEPDVIVMDAEMPVMNGPTFYRHLREGGNDTPVVVLSAYGAQRIRRELDANYALDKPFEADDLVAALDTLIDNASTSRP